MKYTLPWVLLVTACAPLVFITQSLSPAIIGKNILFQAVAIITTLITAYGSYTDTDTYTRLQRTARHPLMVALGVLTLVYGITTIFSYDPVLSLFGEANRGEGFGMFFVLGLLALYMAAFFEKQHWLVFFSIWSVLVVPVTIRAIAEIDRVDRPYSYIGNPIFLAAWYLLSSFAGVFLIAEGRKLLGWIIVGLCSIGILLTMSRGVIIGATLGGIAAAIFAILFLKKRDIIRKVAYGALGCLTAFIILFISTRSQSIWQRVPGLNRIASGDTTTLTSRLIYLDMTIQGFIQEPIKQKIVGWGWDNAEVFLNKYYDPKVYRYDAGNPDRVHNKLGDMLAMTGILGLVSYLVVWYFFVQGAWDIARTKHTTIGIGLLSIGIAYFVQNMFSFDIPILTFSFYTLLAYTIWHQHEKAA